MTVPRTTTLFAVVRSRGPAWQDSLDLESQVDWEPHASFMNALHREGLVVFGGPLAGTPDVLLIVRAESPEEIVSRLAEDPWTVKGLLQVSRVAPWTVRLGRLE